MNYWIFMIFYIIWWARVCINLVKLYIKHKAMLTHINVFGKIVRRILTLHYWLTSDSVLLKSILDSNSSLFNSLNDILVYVFILSWRFINIYIYTINHRDFCNMRSFSSFETIGPTHQLCRLISIFLNAFFDNLNGYNSNPFA